MLRSHLYVKPPAPPPPLECIRGQHACSNFLGERGIYLGDSLGKISRKSPGKGVLFVIANGNSGVEVMGNKHRGAGVKPPHMTHLRWLSQNGMGGGYLWQLWGLGGNHRACTTSKNVTKKTTKKNKKKIKIKIKILPHRPWNCHVYPIQKCQHFAV